MKTNIVGIIIALILTFLIHGGPKRIPLKGTPIILQIFLYVLISFGELISK